MKKEWSVNVFKVRKKEGKTVQAYRLGEEHTELDRLMEAGKLVKTAPGKYEVFSQEAVGKMGEQACDGDFIKIDSSGAPYPNKKEFFLANHHHLGGDSYEQIPKVCDAWTVDEPMCEEIQFLMREKGLVVDENSYENYFSAPLWGTALLAAKNAVIIFYEIKHGETGEMMDADFNFVERTEFEKTYDIVGE